MTDYLAGLVSRGLGRSAGPALAPRLPPEIVGSSPLRPALPVVDSPPSRGADVGPKPAAQSEIAVSGRAVDERPAPEPSNPPRDAERRAGAAAGASRAVAAESPPGRDDVATVHAARRVAIDVPAERPRSPSRRLSMPAASAPAVRPLPAAQPAAPRATAACSPSAAAALPPARRPVELRVSETPPAPPVALRRAPPPSPRIEVRIGRVEVRPPRAAEPVRPVAATPARSPTAENPFADLAAARRYVDRAWR